MIIWFWKLGLGWDEYHMEFGIEWVFWFFCYVFWVGLWVVRFILGLIIFWGVLSLDLGCFDGLCGDGKWVYVIGGSSENSGRLVVRVGCGIVIL